MTGKKNRSGQAGGLRKRAEERARAEGTKTQDEWSPEAARQVLHELRVHQLELETQNEELRRAQAELEASRARYFDLYDLAPVGYCTLSESGLILEANLTAAMLLGVARGTLIKRPFSSLLLPEDEDIYYRHRKQLLETRAPQAYELRMLRKDGDPFWTRLYATAAQDADGAPVCRVVLSDITEHKKAEEVLRESHERFRLANLATFNAIWDWDLRTDAVWREEIGQGVESWRNLIHPEDHDRVAASIHAAIDSGQQYWSDQYRFRRQDGSYAIVDDRGHVTRTANGIPVRMLGAMQEITECKKAEEALRESERALRETLRRLNEGYYSVTPDGLILDHNLAFNRILDIDVGQDLRGRHILDFWQNPDDRQAYLNELMTKGLVWNYLIDVKTASGEKVVGLFNSHLERNEQGELVRIVGTFTDFTERKQTKERIVHLNRILRAVREVNQLIVRERDRDRLIEDACKLLVEGRGYGAAMIVLADEAGVPRAWAEAGMGDAFQPLAESLRRGVLPACCKLAQRHEGIYHVTDSAEVCSLCPIWAKSASSDSSCIRLRHGETTYGYLGVSMDGALGVDPEEESLLAEVAGDVAYALHGIERGEAMTQAEKDRDRAEGELRQSQKMEAVGRLAGGVAHDFNNILTVINASCNFLEEDLHGSKSLLEDVHTIRDAAESAARLTRQLLAFSRRQVLEPRSLDLNVLAGDSEKMLNRLIGEDITIRVEPAPALGLVLADSGQFEQVIVNLAVNARDAMPNGGTLTITTANVELDEVFVSLHAGSRAGPFVRLAVTDTGVGMDAETLARVFEPFFTTKAMGKGTGLGLSTVYGIVKQSSGFISVNSEPGRGATFEIFLPRVESAVQPWQPPSESGSSRGRGETILLVEDNDQLRAVATRALGKLGYRVFGAAGLDEARRIATTEAPIHLLLTDVVMPGGSGRDVSIAVAAGHPAAKVLYMSGFTDDAIAHRGVLDPGTAFLHKPFTQDSLGRKVREVLDG